MDSVDEAALWEKEFRRKGIPSSVRSRPSSSVVQFAEYLAGRSMLAGRAIDIGCGTGRNSTFLASHGVHVTCVDFVDDVLSGLHARAKEAGLGERLSVCRHDVSLPWPFEAEAFDIAIDTFCFRHLVRQDDRDVYAKELARTLKPGGCFLLTLSSDKDAYYTQYVQETDEKTGTLVVDPTTGIPSMLFSAGQISEIFRGDFAELKYENYRDVSEMHGKDYARDSHRFVFERL